MPEHSIRVIARVRAKANCVDQVRAILVGVVQPTRKEPGCRSYQLVQDRQDATDFAFVEEWASAEAEQAHMEASHILGALNKLDGLLAATPEIRRYDVVL